MLNVVKDTRHDATRILFFRLCDNAQGLRSRSRSHGELRENQRTMGYQNRKGGEGLLEK
jgi:hypothetical protein